MDKQSIKNSLHQSHLAFISFLDSLAVQEFLESKNQKWTPAQQLEHIYLSVKPVRLAFSLPKSVLKLLWGKANRNTRSYDELISKYQSTLTNGGRASGRFIPKNVGKQKGMALKEDLMHEIGRLSGKIERFTEEELDTFVLPHPLLGKLTLREMLYFTIHHVTHHEGSTKRNLS